MIDKKKLHNAMKPKEGQVPRDPNLTLEVKNEDVEERIRAYLEEKTPENLRKLVELIRTRRVLVPANVNEKKQPMPCLIKNPQNESFLPIYTCKEQIPREPKSAAIMNMPYLAVNHMVVQQKDAVSGIVINPFTQPLIFKKELIDRIDEAEQQRKAGTQKKTVNLTPEQYLQFERREFEFGHLPKCFFEQGKAMLDELCEKKEAFIDQLFEAGYQQNRMYPYLPEDFSVMVMNISEELLMVRVDLPNRDMGIPSCYRVYFSWNTETGKGRYFTIERTKEAGRRLLGEFGADLKHIDHGEAPAEGAELQRVIDLIQELNS